ncbi:MAG: gliding motility-associated C-terminal domain-containing protein [Saprospiraceae bacterium]
MSPRFSSPNADGINDTFQPLSNCPLINFDLKVFDRRGELVYHSTDGMGWDGTVRGLSAQNGVYVFLLKYQPNNGLVEVVEKGEVSLLR